MTDYNYIEDVLREWCKHFKAMAIVFDKYQSNQILTNLFNDGLPAMQLMPGTMNISDPAKEFQSRVESKTIRHDGNPVTEWMAGNTVAYRDQRDNILPKKDAPNSESKIDGIAALILANAARLNAGLDIKVKKKHPWAVRGSLLGYDAAVEQPVTPATDDDT